MPLITVYRTLSPADAQLVRSLLEAADIPATVTHELSALSMEGYSLATGGIQVQVAEEQAEDARALITEPGTPAE
jgi:hypothetical protein